MSVRNGSFSGHCCMRPAWKRPHPRQMVQIHRRRISPTTPLSMHRLPAVAEAKAQLKQATAVQKQQAEAALAALTERLEKIQREAEAREQKQAMELKAAVAKERAAKQEAKEQAREKREAMEKARKQGGRGTHGRRGRRS